MDALGTDDVFTPNQRLTVVFALVGALVALLVLVGAFA